ncbi:hypothetical protein GQ42DRAFT_117644, partial [Ramicandelaber brevisporus]
MPTSAALPQTKRRRHAGQACQLCRKRKIRCDGATPKCESCTKSNSHCYYEP